MSGQIAFRFGLLGEQGDAEGMYFHQYILTRDELSSGNNFVNTLKYHAVLLYNGKGIEVIDNSINMDEYSVKLFYHDRWDDYKVLIHQDNGIAFAAKEYKSSIKYLQIFAQVEFLGGAETESVSTTASSTQKSNTKLKATSMARNNGYSPKKGVRVSTKQTKVPPKAVKQTGKINAAKSVTKPVVLDERTRTLKSKDAHHPFYFTTTQPFNH